MKKMFLILTMSLATTVLFASVTVVNPKVIEAFKKEFVNVREVRWSEGPDYSIAQFMYNGHPVRAYYSNAGESLGLFRYISSLNLPVNLQLSLKKRYSSFWITDLYEVSKGGSTNYFITIEDAIESVMLKASSDSDWTRFKSVEK